MRKLKLLGLALCLIGTAQATDFRTPLMTGNGLLRNEVEMKKDKWSLNVWSTGHYRSANKAFKKHGTDTEPLSSLIFGKTEFVLAEAFQGGKDTTDGYLAKYYTRNGSPFLAVTKFKPRASYTERGMTLGGTFEYPVWNNKGRVGLRAAVPIRTVRIERDDEGESMQDGFDDCVIRGDVTRMTDKHTTAAVSQVFSGISRYKLSLVNQFKKLRDDGTVVPALELNDAATSSGIDNGSYNKNKNVVHEYKGENIPFVIMYAPGYRPLGRPTGVTVNKVGGDPQFEGGVIGKEVVFGRTITESDGEDKGTALKDLPNTALTGLDSQYGYVFAKNTDYRKLAGQPGFDDLWFSTIHLGSDRNVTTASRGGVDFIERALLGYQVSAEEFLSSNDYVLATNQRTGLGDIDAAAFYEHTFNEDWRGEIFLGVRFPTGASSHFCGNPYKVQLGNGGHFEIKIGGNVSWDAADWVNLKLDASYSFALQDMEQRYATYKGSTVKNIGNCVGADVDWGYFLGHFDATFFHSKTDRLASTFGYEFYFKTEDNITFKNKSSHEHFLGEAWSDADGPVALNGKNGTKFGPLEMELDSKLAEAGTESIAHRLRFETSWRLHKYVDVYGGGAYTFAGQNVPRETDGYCGMKVRF